MNGSKIIIIICLLLILIYVIKSKPTNLKYVKSDIDDKEYLVRDLPDKQQAANMLARIRINIMKIDDYLINNIDKYPEMADYIRQLHQKIKYTEYSESTEDSTYTSYSVNKGEQIVFCLRSKSNPNKMHDINLVMYVALHEISHVACPEYGHGDLFKKIFGFITQVAIEQGFYHRIAFDKDPTEYCGLVISDSII